MGRLFIPVPIKSVLVEITVYGMTTAQFGESVVHAMRCWTAGTVGKCCPEWVQEAWADGIANNRRGMRATPYRHYGPDWPEIRAAIVERDGCCRGCGATGQLDVHHRVPFRLFDRRDDANDAGNLVALCRACHAKADAEYRSNGTVFPQFLVDGPMTREQWDGGLEAEAECYAQAVDEAEWAEAVS